MPQAVIMAGGPGERFWPLTDKKFPKYRIRLDGKTSLLQKTYQRLQKIYKKSELWIVTTREHLPLIRQEIPAQPRNRIILEPFRKNTAAAIHLSTLTIGAEFGRDEIVSFFPADHLIRQENLFQATLRQALSLAAVKNILVTVGIEPTFPATAYGYIQRGEALDSKKTAFYVSKFAEKPDHATAIKYIKAKSFLWNGGIFTWRTGVFIETLKRLADPAYSALRLDRVRAGYLKLPSLSIDYALLEKTDNLAVVTTKMDWCDMGDWDMFYEKAEKDSNHNRIHGNVNLAAVKDSLVLNYSKKPLSLYGAEKIIAVVTDQGTLVTQRGRSEEAARFACRGGR